MDLISDEGYRQDGRKSHDLRKIKCKLGVYAQADGSAYLEQGLTKVLAAVYGPHEITRNKSQAPADKVFINCQYSTATFSGYERKFRPRGDRKSHEFTQLLRKTFESLVMTDAYPHSQLDIFCEILQSDGGNLSACINAASLALIDAGVPLKSYAVSCTCACYNNVVVADANRAEETKANTALITLAISPKNDDIVLLELNSKMHAEQLENAIDEAIRGCKAVHEVLDQAVRDHVTNVAMCLGWQDTD